jgi:hypothetical protein
MGEKETKPWTTAGVGARRYAAIKEVLRASTLEEEEGGPRRLRPLDRT